jgi:membrane protease subunit HflK
VASGIYTVGAGERGVVLTFGALSGITEPGLNYRIPWPIQSHHAVDIATVRRAEIGFRTTADSVRQVPEAALMLTGDENIVHLELFVQYVVQDPAKFLFQVRNAEQVLANAAEVALRSEVGQHPIESTMTEGRVTVQAAVRNRLQTLLDGIDSGLQVTEARLLTVDPPREVREAFLEVVRAFEDRERIVREAEAYAERVIPEARGEAARMTQEAEAYREQRVIRAQGDADRFTAVLDEYRHAPAVTRERLHLEAIERALAQTEKVIVDTDAGATTLLPLRPLMAGVAAAAPAEPSAAPSAPAPAPRPTPTAAPTPTRR